MLLLPPLPALPEGDCSCCYRRCRYNASIGLERDDKRTTAGCGILEAPLPRTAWARGALQWDGGEEAAAKL